jgi:GT2 family glycosyltransferase
MLPSVNVLVLNYNGRRHLEPCFSALRALDYPRERLELVLADNGSRDDSLALLARRFPEVRALHFEHNHGFAGGYNRAVAAAQGELVVLLNNDTRVPPDWLRELVGCWQRHQPGCAAVASVMLSWDGRRVEFGGARLNFHGFGFQTANGWRYEPGGPGPERPIPFGCGGALLVERQAFLDAGGFDEDYFAYYEDVDLGWRLWLLGREIWLAPASVVYHRVHGTRMAPLELQRRLELNALRTIVKNFEPATLDRALPAALQLAVYRALAPRARAVRGTALAPLLAIDALAQDWPALHAKRAALQARRRRSDAELFARFGTSWLRPAWGDWRYVQRHQEIVAGHGLAALVPPDAPGVPEEPDDFVALPPPPPPAALPVATPWWRLPRRALEHLRAGGLQLLWHQIKLYILWRRARRGAGGAEPPAAGVRPSEAGVQHSENGIH